MTPRFDDPRVYNFTIVGASDYSRTWALLDRMTAASILEAGLTYILTVKSGRNINLPSLLSLTNAVDNTVSGIVSDVQVAASGLLKVTFLNSDISSLPAESYYELGVVYPDGLYIVYVMGQISCKAA